MLYFPADDPDADSDDPLVIALRAVALDKKGDITAFAKQLCAKLAEGDGGAATLSDFLLKLLKQVRSNLLDFLASLCAQRLISSPCAVHWRKGDQGRRLEGADGDRRQESGP